MHARLAVVSTCAAIALTLCACGGNDEQGDDVGNPESQVSVEDATAPLEDTSPELAAIREQGNELLEGGTEAFGERLTELQGTPVVVNKWASWCGPCRAEFPYFQSAALERGDEIAFLGIDSGDADDVANTFLQELPLPYPSYVDPDLEIQREFLDNPVGFPATGFL